MYKKLFFTFTFLFAFYSYSQVCLGTDATVCVGSTVQIDNCGSGGSAGVGVMLNNATQVNLSDDSWSGVVNIGFTFNFYGNNYTQCIIGSNGLVSFNTSMANGYNAWSLNGTPLPNTGINDAKNAAMLCYQDINPNSGGQIFYQTMGVAPNREFYVIYANIPMYSSGECSYQSLVFYETSNIIDFYLGHKPVSSWNGGRAIQGLENSSGTVAHIVPGRNNSVWTVTNDAKRFTPTSPNNTNNYTITTVPYLPIFASNISYAWEDTNGQTFPYNNGSLIVNNVVAGPVGYYLTISGSQCQSLVGAISDTTFITGVTSSVTASAVDDICSGGIGSVTATPTSGTPPYTYFWPSLGGATTQTVNNVSAGTYQVQMTDDMGCSSTASVTVGDVPASYPSSTTLVSCQGGADGTATVTMNPVLGNVSYQWNDPNNQTTSTATGLSAGTYECVVTSDIGCTKTVQVTIGEIPGMQIQVVSEIDATCNSGSDGIAILNVTDGTDPYSYSWEGSSSTSQTASDLSAGTHIVTVTDSNGCVSTIDVNIGEPNPLSVTYLSQDTIICIGDSVQLSAIGGGGSSPYIYQWFLNGELVGNGNEINVTPTSGYAEYCVVVSEVCGSPSAMKCMYVSWPNDVVPMLMPDKPGGCFPFEVEFENTTNTLEKIDYTIWTYSNGGTDTVSGSSSVTHEFGEGLFGVGMTLFTERGCEYVENFPNLIEGYSNPIADFYVNPNPASMYEPNVKAYSQSGNKIIGYQWFSESATPSYSEDPNPTFQYPNEVANYPLLLVVEDIHGCVDSISKLVRIQNDVLLFAPNSFTPDGDGYNETWGISILGVDIYNFHLEVFNRWGEKVFESFDAEGRWDGNYGGSIVKDGAYIWKIRAFDYENDNKYEFNGVVNIIR